MVSLSRTITESRVPSGSVVIFWLGQAGFVFKDGDGTIIYIDPYLSNAVEQQHGFKRIMASPIEPDMVLTDLVISTHGHADHLDPVAIPIIARNPRARFAGSAKCVNLYRATGMGPDRYFEIRDGTTHRFRGVEIIGVYADHGEDAPDAVGVVLDFGGIRVYHTGDTTFRREKMHAIAALKPDIILASINGNYGSMDADDAAHLTHFVGARLAIPAHFWMFVQQKGNPARFLQACKETAPGVKTLLLTQGERFAWPERP